MQAYFLAGNPVILIITGAIVAVLLQTAFVVCGFPTILTLERGFAVNHVVELSELKDRDSVRHPRILQQQQQQQQASVGSVVDFPVQGTYDPFRVGLYFTRVQLGSPPKEYFVQIDTGSDVLWVSCASCEGCPRSSGLQIPIQFYDPSSSSTASLIRCSDQRCSLGSQSLDSSCSKSNDQCIYTFQYGDGSGTSGFYVSDQIQLDTIVGDSTSSNASASVVFGCSMSQTGDLTKSDRAVDGIFGFGQQGLSVIAQLSSQGVAPDAFSHCLVGNGAGGGILVLGQIIEPSMVYTPLIPSQPHYNLNLLSISVNGRTLSIDPSMFGTSGSRGGTIIDSGTTLAYLAEEAYDPFVDAITLSVSQSVRPLVSKDSQCYLVASSTPDIFPTVSLNFAGGASMILRPQDYLLQQNSVGGAALWCIGFQKIRGQGITILGDLVLKDKIVVYDLGGQRIGWANYDCTSSVNVSTSSSGGRSEYVAGQFNDSTSLQDTRYSLILTVFVAFVLQLSVIVAFS
ncbi:putative nepenthesin [Helianthus annuus]|uniref:Nepenthesin n=1 Tax=Helianthus annuus TaxID=4232 RepID=A0A251TCC4_HELAN|nr:aspartic proteinase-like protein 2 [Helianthus annuus]KAF5783635.1 putative nepenthesin [Helianthus annuus]KAJ0502919.1 putative nepenthesin [Helianthus annuus]KAJ0518884.1 putative nepenthesin [Helianthus annuus]